MESRLQKIEKTVEKIHNEFKLKLFDGVIDNLDDKPNKADGASLTLNFEHEKGTEQKQKPTEPVWNDVYFSNT